MGISRDRSFSLKYNNPRTVHTDGYDLAVTEFRVAPMLGRKDLDGLPAIVIMSNLAGIVCTPVPFCGDRDPVRELTRPKPTNLNALRQSIASILRDYKRLFAGAVFLLFLPKDRKTKAVRDNNLRVFNMLRQGLKVRDINVSFYNHLPRPKEPDEDWEYGNGLLVDGRNLEPKQYPTITFNGDTDSMKLQDVMRMSSKFDPIPADVRQGMPRELWLGSLKEPQEPVREPMRVNPQNTLMPQQRLAPQRPTLQYDQRPNDDRGRDRFRDQAPVLLAPVRREPGRPNFRPAPISQAPDPRAQSFHNRIQTQAEVQMPKSHSELTKAGIERLRLAPFRNQSQGTLKKRYEEKAAQRRPERVVSPEPEETERRSYRKIFSRDARRDARSCSPRRDDTESSVRRRERSA